MRRELEWKNVRGLDVLCTEDGQVIATVRRTHEDLWVAHYGDDPKQHYHERDLARRAMVKRDEMYQQVLADEKTKAEKKSKEKEVKGAGKNS